MREQLTPQLIGDTWVVALGMVGELEGFEGTHVELHDGTPLDADERVIGTVIGATVLRCEGGELVGRVAFDETSAIVGILIVPTDHGPLPF